MRMRKTLLVISAFMALCGSVYAQCTGSPNCTVKAAGGGGYTTIQACANAMAPGDTCKVFVGTYSESPSISAGSVGSYKTITVNTGDVVNVTGGFTLNSHTKLSGFVLNHTGSCISLASSATDVFIGPNNSLTSCGTIAVNSGNSFIFIQGNTFAYAGCVPPNPVSSCGRWINEFGSNVMIENNDMSHYQLGIVYGGLSPISDIIIRNNTFHDQLETEAGSNGHSDSIFSEPQTGVSNVLIEGNQQRNAVGPNAKGFLSQNDAGCAATCKQLIIRFNSENRTGSGAITNDKSWPNVNLYNNTLVDEGQEAGFNAPGGGGDNMLSSGGGMTSLNNLWFVGTQNFSSWNPVMCNSCVSFGHSLAFCVNTCTIFNHVYQGSTFTADPGNKVSNPLFVNYVSVGSASNNFNLQSGSPAITAGTNLTTVAATDTGTGTSLIVNNASFFQDGYGLANAVTTVQGDCISINVASNHVCVTAVNYSTNTLTLSGSITRSSGQAVYLYSKSDAVQVLTGSLPDIGAFPFTSGTASFTCSPNVVPASHVGNISLTCTGTGTSWTGSTAFTVGAPATFVSKTNNSATSETIVISTSASTGTSTITDTTDSISTTITVSTATLSINPTSGNPGAGGCTTTCRGTLTLTGTNTIWTLETAAGLFSVSGAGCTGDSIGNPTVTTNTAATALLTWGSTGCTITVTDNSTGATATFTVATLTLPSVTTGTAGTPAVPTTTVSGSSYTCTGSCASVTSEGVCYSTVALPTTPCTSDGTTSPFSSSLSVSPGTTYNYRAFATNSVGTAFGSVNSFTTPTSTVITYVNDAGNASSTGSNTFTFNFTPLTIGDAVTFAIYCNGAASPPTSATISSAGWTITQLIAPINNGGTASAALWGAIAPVNTSSTFTVEFFTAGPTPLPCSNFYGYLVAEFAGNDPTGGSTTFNVTGASGAASGGCNQSAASITPTLSNTAIWYACYDNATGATSPWILGTEDGNGGDFSIYQTLTGGAGITQTPNFAGTTGGYIVLGTVVNPGSVVASGGRGFVISNGAIN